MPNIRACYRHEIYQEELETLHTAAEQLQPLRGVNIQITDVSEVPIVSHEDVHSANNIKSALKLREKYAFGSNQRFKDINIPPAEQLQYSGHHTKEVHGVFHVFGSKDSN